MNKHYGSVYKRYACFWKPEEVQWLPNGSKVILQPVKIIQFEGYRYSTENEEEQQFIENHTDFKRGMMMSLDTPSGRPQHIFEGSSIGEAAPVPRFSHKILIKLGKPELIEYCTNYLQVALPHSAAEIMDGKMTRDELLAFAESA